MVKPVGFASFTSTGMPMGGESSFLNSPVMADPTDAMGLGMYEPAKYVMMDKYVVVSSFRITL